MKAKNNLRIDKNIAYNIIEVNKIEDVQTQIIIRGLLIYFSLSYQADLFGYGVLDPHDFAEKMNLNIKNLLRKHPNPKFIEDSNLSEKKLYEREKNNDKYNNETRVWDSYLENALYIMFSTPIFEKYKGSTEDQDFIGLKNHLLIKEIQLFPKKNSVGRRTKLYYKYKLDDYFERNLRRFFLQINFATFQIAQSKGVDSLYLTVMNIYNSYKTKGLNIYHFKFNDLLSYFNINEDLEPRRKKEKLNVQLKKLDKIIKPNIPGFKFDWIAGDGQRFKYVPVIIWDKIDLKIEKENDYKVTQDVFYKHLRKNLYEIYQSQYKGNTGGVNGFYRWLKSDEDKDLKISSYVSTNALYNKYRGSMPDPKTFANRFFKDKVGKANNVKEMELAFSGFHF